ncbi:hypothetical protein AAVH_29978 [Aphelenchoides avenae]|nr:hypothetical protein AAVH_29978 [Aphelenchus avenae]
MAVIANDLLTLVPLVYALPAFLIYLVIATTTLQRLHGPFYRFIAVNGIYDCMKWIDTFFLFKARYAPVMWPLFDALPLNGTIATFFHNYLPLFSYIFSTFVVINRMTATFVQAEYGRIWRPLFPIALAAALLIPLFRTVGILTGGARIETPEHNATVFAYVLHINDADVEERYELFKNCLALSYVITGFGMNVTMLVHFIKARKNKPRPNNHLNVDGTTDVEWKMFFLSVKIFMLNMLHTVPELIAFAKGQTPTEPISSSSPRHYWKMFTSDLHVVIMPIFILELCPSIKQIFLALVKRTHATTSLQQQSIPSIELIPK